MLPEGQIQTPAPLMKIRLHRGGLAESMETMEQIEPTKKAIYDYFCRADLLGLQETDTIEVKPYANRAEQGWDAHYIVLLDGSAAAFTDRDVIDSDKVQVLPGVHDGEKLTLSAKVPGLGIVPVLVVHAPPHDPSGKTSVSTMVQHYSVALLLNVYNEKQILNLLLLGELNKTFANTLQPEDSPSERSNIENWNWSKYAKQALGKYYREDGKYAEALWNEVVLAGGWPSYRVDVPVKPLSELFNL